MKIGITYDLREDYLDSGHSKEETAELDKAETIDAIDEAIRNIGHETDRIGNAENLMKRLIAGDRWNLVFNIAEGLYGLCREALVPAILDAYRIPYTFSDPLVLGLTLHKGMTKRVIRDLNIPTPDFAVISDINELCDVSIPFPVFAKPVAEGTSKGISEASIINSKDQLEATVSNLLNVFHQPVLIEKYLPGREFTVGIIGTGKKAKTVGVLEIVLREKAEKNIYSFSNKANYRELVDYILVDDQTAAVASGTALSVWRGLGCRDGGRVDLRCDESGVPNFIEVNPLAGLNPVDSDLPILCRLSGISYQHLISMIMDSVFDRL
jgi:D-alanine-D-alanine ligase